MRWQAILALAGAAALSGCGTVQSLVGDARDAVGDPGLGRRCADMMRQAFPGAEIRVTRAQASAAMADATAQVEGERQDVPAGGPLPRKVAVECRFDHDVLTSFRWTAGPLR
jgi:uncharacterized protein (DUF4415 family)